MQGYDCTAREGSIATAILLHPHPDFGGNRYHPVVDALYHGLPVSTLRFDFSSSTVAVAQADVREAIDLAPDPAVVLIGYSFGADVALSIADARVLAWYVVAPPLRLVDPGAMAAPTDPRPKRLVVPDHDQYSPPGRAIEITAGWVATTVETIPGDHFLVGHAAEVLASAVSWLPAVVSS
jgi:alpha/beta superfamily hydrolase